MLQQPSDADVIAHAEDLIRRRRADIIEEADADPLLTEIEIVVEALRRHQPVDQTKGWNDAWDRFDGGPAKI